MLTFPVGNTQTDPESYSRDYGFITDYFCEILHELRRIDVLSKIRKRFELIDSAATQTGLSGRDQRAIFKVGRRLTQTPLSNAEMSDEELREVLVLAANCANVSGSSCT